MDSGEEELKEGFVWISMSSHKQDGEILELKLTSIDPAINKDPLYKGFNFIGYDYTTASTDPKGVLRLQRTSQKYEKEPETRTIGRTELETQMKGLKETINDIKNSWEYKNLNNFDTSKLDRLRAQYTDMERIIGQVKESLDDPDVFRGEKQRVVSPSTSVKGIDYVVDRRYIRIQTLVPGNWFLKGDELVIHHKGIQILANRYLSDPRVIVRGTFEGDVRMPQNVNPELDEQTKTNLAILLKRLYPDIREVCFGNEKKEIK